MQGMPVEGLRLRGGGYRFACIPSYYLLSRYDTSWVNIRLWAFNHQASTLIAELLRNNNYQSINPSETPPYVLSALDSIQALNVRDFKQNRQRMYVKRSIIIIYSCLGSNNYYCSWELLVIKNNYSHVANKIILIFTVTEASNKTMNHKRLFKLNRQKLILKTNAKKVLSKTIFLRDQLFKTFIYEFVQNYTRI